jgi:hypothetical protein
MMGCPLKTIVSPVLGSSAHGVRTIFPSVVAASVIASLNSSPVSAVEVQNWSIPGKAREEILKMQPNELDVLSEYLAECANRSNLVAAVHACDVARNRFKIQLGATYPMVEMAIDASEKAQSIKRLISGGVAPYTADTDNMLMEAIQDSYKAKKK